MRVATRRACPRTFPLRAAPRVVHRLVRSYVHEAKAAREKAYSDLKVAKDRYDADQAAWQPVVQALLRFGAHMEEDQKTAEAEECFKEAHRIANHHNPGDLGTALLVGNTIRNQGRFNDALVYYDETIGKLEKKSPTNPAEWSVLGHALEGKAKCVVLQDDVPSAIPIIKDSLDSLKRGLPMTFAESSQEWVKFLMGIFEKPHLQAERIIADLSFAELLCHDAIVVLQGAVSDETVPNAPQSLVDMSSIKTNQLNFVGAEADMDKAYEVWRQHVRPIIGDDEQDLMEMQMRVLTARRSHANPANAAHQHRKALADYTTAIRLGESKDNPLKKPAFDLLATAYTGLGHLRAEFGGNAEAEKCFGALRSLHRSMLTLPDPLTISASFITKRVQLAMQTDRYLLKLHLLNRRSEPVWAHVSIRGSQSASAQAVGAGKELRLELPNINLVDRPLDHFQEVVVQVYDQSKQKALDVHREFVMTT